MGSAAVARGCGIMPGKPGGLVGKPAGIPGTLSGSGGCSHGSQSTAASGCGGLGLRRLRWSIWRFRAAGAPAGDGGE